MNQIDKISSSIKKNGLIISFYKIILYSFDLFKDKLKEKKIFKSELVEDRFTEIYKSNYWGNNESVSGSGSTLLYTENLRNKLPDLFQKYSIKSIFDAPCGDLNWMKLLLAQVKINYIGGDIVKEIISSHISSYKDSSTDFIHIDLIKDKFPSADLMICRDCLFHLSFEDTRALLNNFINSNIPYLLTTTHKNVSSFQNQNIQTGGYREIDLFSAPYLFDINPIERIDDWKYPEPEREMCLWSRDQIKTSLKIWKI
jgi:hypothetical protein